MSNHHFCFFVLALLVIAISLVAEGKTDVSMLPVDWRIRIPGMGPPMGAAVSQDERWYYTADSHHLYAIDISSREVKWKYRFAVATPTATPISLQTVRDIDAVFFGGADNGGLGSVGITALNGTTGKLLWTNTTFNAPSSAVPSIPGKILVNLEGNFAAVDALTGDIAWAAKQLDTVQTASVSPNGKHFVVYTSNGYGISMVISVSAETGKTVWSTPSTLTLRTFYGISDEHVAVSAATIINLDDSSAAGEEEKTTIEYNNLLVLNIQTGALVANISCGFERRGTGSASSADSNGECNGAALYAVGRTNMLAYISGNGTLYTANTTTATSAKMPLAFRYLYSLGGPTFPYSGFTVTLSANAAGIAVALGGYSGSANVTLIPTDGSGSVSTIFNIPSAPNGLSMTPLGSKCVISTNVQGFIVFSVADGSVLGRNEDAPGSESVVSLDGGRSIIIPSDAKVTTYSTKMCV